MVRVHNANFNKTGKPLPDVQHKTFFSDGTTFRLQDAPISEHRYYDLRHFHASNMLRKGIPDPYVAARLGHHPGVLKTTYQYLLPEFESEWMIRWYIY